MVASGWSDILYGGSEFQEELCLTIYDLAWRLHSIIFAVLFWFNQKQYVHIHIQGEGT